VRRRFFVEKFTGTTASMEGDAAHHLGHVLRAEEGQLYELSDGSAAWVGRIAAVSRNRIEFALIEKLRVSELSLDLTLLLSIVKFDAFEWAIEKATELGVSRIVPLAAARSEKNLVSAAVKRSDRWRKILLESSQQSRRLRVPELAEPAKPTQAFADKSYELQVVLSERFDAPPIRTVLGSAHSSNASVKSAALAIGPEGGWTDDELASARSAGFHEASLGSLILRTETAVIAALSIVNFALSSD
jgi:16S rRNA (uracil1498-N3)-methyltransferase